MIQASRKYTLGFAAIGLLVTALFVLYQMVMDSPAPSGPTVVDVASIVLCPTSLLALPISLGLFDADETGSPGFYVMWAFIGLLNSILYAVIGAWYFSGKNRAAPSKTVD
jgi:hypothetical protein